MPGNSPFEVHEIQATIRFIQGYRYLDRCGEALIRLEDVLQEGWIPAEVSPKSGNLKNELLGMVAAFNSEAMTVAQSEFISFENFQDQACKVFETLWRVFELQRINAPTARVVMQKGFKERDIEEASRYLLNLKLCVPRPELVQLVGGELNAADFVLTTEEDLRWNDELVHRRRRFQAKVLRQERRPSFESRLLTRARLLPKRQREAIEAVQQLRRRHPEIAPVAVQVDVEQSLETEFLAESFDFPTFLQQSWEWGAAIRTEITRL